MKRKTLASLLACVGALLVLPLLAVMTHQAILTLEYKDVWPSILMGAAVLGIMLLLCAAMIEVTRHDKEGDR